jgi:hypothetical protein
MGWGVRVGRARTRPKTRPILVTPPYLFLHLHVRKIVGVAGRTATLLGHTPRRQLSLPAQKLLLCTVLGVQVEVKSSLRTTTQSLLRTSLLSKPLSWLCRSSTIDGWRLGLCAFPFLRHVARSLVTSIEPQLACMDCLAVNDNTSPPMLLITLNYTQV